MDYKLLVYKKDGRTRDGRRLVLEAVYPNYSGNAMMDEIKYLKTHDYKPEDGYILDFTWV